MATLMPRGYGGFPSYQFGAPNQFHNQHYNGGYPRQGASFVPHYPRQDVSFAPHYPRQGISYAPYHPRQGVSYAPQYPTKGMPFAPHYPTQPLYQPPMRPADRAVVPYVNPYREPGIGTQLILWYNEADARYRQEQYARKLEKMQRKYWKQQANNLPPQFYNTPGAIYFYEKETQYIPYPVPVGPGGRSYGVPSSNITFGSGGVGGFGGFGGGGGGGMNLTPKVRVIFIPAGQSSYQQPWTGSLAVPPFLYNRISQPLSSFPIPPPLPQIGSLPLTPAVQQMVVQRYSNPVAVLPFTPNWQAPQMMLPGYPQIPQQQQPCVPPISAAPPPPQLYMPPVPQAYIPPLPPAPIAAVPPAQPTYAPPPPAPQAYVPSAPQTFVPQAAPQAYVPPAPQTFVPQPAPQAYVPPAPQTFVPQPAPQAYIPPAPQTFVPSPDQQAYIPPPAPPIPTSALPAAPQTYVLPPPPPVLPPSQYSYGGYPSICRACPPAPPPLNIPVTGHCWVQHCSACHHVPTPISNPNARPAGGRITPLLRQPTVPQYIPEQAKQQYLYDNAPVLMRPWLRKTPPIPPGAVVISDEIVNKDGSTSQYKPSPRQHRQHERSSGHKYRSATLASRANPPTNSTNIKDSRSVSPKRNSINSINSNQHQGPAVVKDSVAASPSSTSSSGLSAEFEKTVHHSSTTEQNVIPEPLTREARNVNLQYKYQPEELPSVYLFNRYLKSSSESSTLSSTIQALSNPSSPFTKRLGAISPSSPSLSSSSTNSKSIKKEVTSKREDEKPPRPPSRSRKPKDKIIIVREFTTSSPSTLSTISSNMAFSVRSKDDDSISTTSTLKADHLEDDDIPRRNLF